MDHVDAPHGLSPRCWLNHSSPFRPRSVLCDCAGSLIRTSLGLAERQAILTPLSLALRALRPRATDHSSQADEPTIVVSAVDSYALPLSVIPLIETGCASTGESESALGWRRQPPNPRSGWRCSGDGLFAHYHVAVTHDGKEASWPRGPASDIFGNFDIPITSFLLDSPRSSRPSQQRSRLRATTTTTHTEYSVLNQQQLRMRLQQAENETARVVFTRSTMRRRCYLEDAFGFPPRPTRSRARCLFRAVPPRTSTCSTIGPIGPRRMSPLHHVLAHARYFTHSRSARSQDRSLLP